MNSNTINDAQTVVGNGEGTLLAGRFRVVRQLGRGGMGSVWLVEDTLLDDMPFAVKMLPSVLVNNKRAYAQLKAEALVSLKLVHPNIVQLRAFEENNGNPFLVMDYIDGQTLDDYLADYNSRVERVDRVDGIGGARRPAEPIGSRDPRDRGGRGTRPACPPGGLPEADVLRILRPIAAALDYAHSQGVVHRDVKPANVMIRKDGHPFILDFGIAREIQETMTRVTGKLSSGTLLYMSPEQLNGARPRKEQDIYSFAAMAFECLKGEPPFSHGQIEFQIMNKQPEPLPGGPRSVAAAIMAGLAKKPEDRPATCAAVLEGKDSSRVERAERVEGGGDGFGHKEHKDRKEPVGSRVPLDRSGGESFGGAGLELEEARPPRAKGQEKPRRVGAEAVNDIPEEDLRYLPPDARAQMRSASHSPVSRGTVPVGPNRGPEFSNLCMSSQETRSANGELYVAMVVVVGLLLTIIVCCFGKIKSMFYHAEPVTLPSYDIAARRAYLAPQKPVRQPERKQEKPMIYLTASVDGVQKKAHIFEGLVEKDRYTPIDATINLPIGAKSYFAVQMMENGVVYSGVGEYVAKEGRQHLDVEMKPVKVCRNCGHRLPSYLQTAKCPRCQINVLR